MPTLTTTKRTRQELGIAEPPTWDQILHDVANEVTAVKLQLIAIGMAADENERTRHLEAAKQAIAAGEYQLQVLRGVLRRQLGSGGFAGPKPGTRTPKRNLKK